LLSALRQLSSSRHRVPSKPEASWPATSSFECGGEPRAEFAFRVRRRGRCTLHRIYDDGTGPVDHRGIHDLDTRFGPLRIHLADLHGEDRHKRQGDRTRNRSSGSCPRAPRATGGAIGSTASNFSPSRARSSRRPRTGMGHGADEGQTGVSVGAIVQDQWAGVGARLRAPFTITARLHPRWDRRWWKPQTIDARR
jgi:hypothetical protein